LEVRLDAVAAVLLAGLSDRRAGRMVGISKTEVGDSMDLLFAGLAALGYCQPEGTFITALADLRERLGEMARTCEGGTAGLAKSNAAEHPFEHGNERLVEVALARPGPGKQRGPTDVDDGEA
jgi:hypothetical protein